jgi:hypothetical protein
MFKETDLKKLEKMGFKVEKDNKKLVKEAYRKLKREVRKDEGFESRRELSGK